MIPYQPLPVHFVANEHLCAFLLSNGFIESTLPPFLCNSPEERNFNHRSAEVSVGVNFSEGSIQLGQADGWLHRHYVAVPTAALVFLLTHCLQTTDDRAIFHRLAGPYAWRPQGW